MDVLSQRTTLCSSALNPNAPLFVPLAYRTVEDFSDEWWALVHSSPWFREYWLQERFQDPENDSPFSDIDDLILPDVDVFDDYADQQKEKESEYSRDLVKIGGMKWQRGRNSAESPRYIEKAPKIVNVKVSPRMIQQPR